MPYQTHPSAMYDLKFGTHTQTHTQERIIVIIMVTDVKPIIKWECLAYISPALGHGRISILFCIWFILNLRWRETRNLTWEFRRPSTPKPPPLVCQLHQWVHPDLYICIHLIFLFAWYANINQALCMTHCLSSRPVPKSSFPWFVCQRHCTHHLDLYYIQIFQKNYHQNYYLN